MQGLLETIGNTPLIDLEGILIKCEYRNPSGSIKARTAKYIIDHAERSGQLKPEDTIVEATSGNMGNALAMVAAIKGYRMLVLMPEGFSHEREMISRGFGAEVRRIGQFHLHGALQLARELGDQPGFFHVSQFDNLLNIEENRLWLGSEIVQQLPKGVLVDAIVQGVGTGGTLIGVGQAIRELHNPECKLFAVEPVESRTIAKGEIGVHRIEGIADGFVPSLYEQHAHLVEGVIAIGSGEAVDYTRWLGKKHGHFVGPSSGANFLAAKKVKERHPEIRTVLTFFCDEGEKYLQELFD